MKSGDPTCGSPPLRYSTLLVASTRAAATARRARALAGAGDARHGRTRRSRRGVRRLLRPRAAVAPAARTAIGLRAGGGRRRGRVAGLRRVLPAAIAPVARAAAGLRAGRRRGRGCARRRAIIVAIGVDLAAFAVLHAVDTVALARRHDAVGTGACFVAVDAVLTVLQAVGLAASQRAIAGAVLDAPIVARIATLDARRAVSIPASVLATGPAVLAAIGMAPALAAIPSLLVIVALAIDFAALAICHAVDASALLRRHHTIGAGASLCPIDRPLALLKARGLAAGDLAVANAALDAVLLVILALVDAGHRLRVRAAADEQAARQHCVRNSAEYGHRSLSSHFDGGCTVLESLRLRIPRHPSKFPSSKVKTARPVNDTTTPCQCPNCPRT